MSTAFEFLVPDEPYNVVYFIGAVVIVGTVGAFLLEIISLSFRLRYRSVQRRLGHVQGWIIRDDLPRDKSLLVFFIKVLDWVSATSICLIFLFVSTFSYIPAWLSGFLICIWISLVYIFKTSILRRKGQMILQLVIERIKPGSVSSTLDSVPLKSEEENRIVDDKPIHEIAGWSRRQTILFIISTLLIFGLVFFVCFAMEDICIASNPMDVSTRFSRSFLPEPCVGPNPCHVYVTMSHNVTSFIVHFHSLHQFSSPFIRYDLVSHSQDIFNYSFIRVAMEYHLDMEKPRYLYYAYLYDLLPDTTYYFVVGNGTSDETYSKEKKLRTGPIDDSPFLWATGGDMGATPAVELLNHLATSREILFAAVGGDVAYIEAFPTCYRRWDWWLDAWERSHTPLGYTVPLIMAIGNHEAGGYEMSKTSVPFFFHYFVHEPFVIDPIELSTYHSHVIGNETLLLALDSDIIENPGGAQAEWLDRQLTLHARKTNKYAIYHVPLYPSIRAFEDPHSTSVRNAWLPIFDEHNLTIGFENHDHGYKRTHLMKNNTVVNGTNTYGTLYVGDGSWGVLRTGQLPKSYLFTSLAENFVFYVSTNTTSTLLEAFNQFGITFDSVVQYPYKP